MDSRQRADVVILTIIPEEFDAMVTALGSPQAVPAPDAGCNLNPWREATCNGYRVVVGCATQQGNDFSQSIAHDALERFEPNMLLLVGIAGGLPHKDGIAKGDVVIATQLHYYEYGKLGEAGYTARPRSELLNPALAGQSLQLRYDAPEWFGDSRRDGGDIPNIVQGGIASGEKLIASLKHDFAQAILKICGEQARAIEMEAWGCATATRQAQHKLRPVSFGVIRGISDVPTTEDSASDNSQARNDWKSRAATVAARLTVALLHRDRWPYPPIQPSGQQREPASPAEDPDPVPLTLQVEEWRADSIGRFHYSARATELFGREREWAMLEHFAFKEIKPGLRWQLLTGAAGTGKSRLAFELCLKAHDRGWRAGFLSNHGNTSQNLLAGLDTLRAPGWQASAPTLIVLDYVQTHAEAIGDCLHHLATRKDLRQPLRLLLLERAVEDDWYSRQLLGSGTRASQIDDARFEKTLELQELDESTRQKLLQAALKRFGGPANDDANLLKLASRPLFALFAADALAHGATHPTWSREGLLKHVLEREEKRWSALHIDDDERELLLLGTLCSGFVIDENLPQPLQERLERIQTRERPPLGQRLQALSGQAGLDGNRIPKLEPDLFGEFFVLEQLEPPQNACDAQRRQHFEQQIKTCWNTNPRGTMEFLLRAGRDFPKHSRMRALLQFIPGDEAINGWAFATALILDATAATDPQDALSLYRLCRQRLSPDEPKHKRPRTWLMFGLSTAASSPDLQMEIRAELHALYAAQLDEPGFRWLWSSTAVSLMAHLGAHDRAAAEALYQQLVTLAAEHPDEAALRERQARAAFNLLNAHLGAHDRAAAEALYRPLVTLAAEHPDEAALREQQAQAAVNLIAHLGAHDRATAEALYQQLATLAAEHPDEAALRERQARAAVNLIADLGAHDRATAEALYQQLVTLAAEHPDEAALRERQAEAAFNLIADLGAHDRATAEALYQQLVTLAAEHPDEAALRERQAQAAFNLITDLSAHDRAAAEALYRQLVTLAEAHPDEAALREIQAQAAVNLIANISAHDRAAAEALYRQLVTLAEAHPDEAALRERQAQAAVNLIADLGAHDRAAAEALYRQLVTLAAEHPDEAALREQQARAAFNLITDLSAHDRAAAEALYRQLVTLAQEHPDEAALRERQTQAAVNLLNAHLRTHDRAAAETLYQQLVTLAAEHPDEAALREQQARAAFNLITDLSAHDRAAAEALYRQLVTLAQEHPDEAALRERQTQAAVNLLNAHLRTHDRAAAETLYQQLVTLAAKHPDEAALREQQAGAAFNLKFSILTTLSDAERATTLRQMAVLALQAGAVEKAGQCLADAFNYYDSVNDIPQQVAVLSEAAALAQACGDQESGGNLLQQALALARQSGDAGLMAQVQSWLAAQDGDG